MNINVDNSYKKHHLLILAFIIVIICAVYYSRNFGFEQRYVWLWNLTIFEYQTVTFGILFIIPIVYAGIYLNIRLLVVTWLLCGLLMLPRVVDLSFHPESLIRAYVVFTLPFFLALFLKTEAMWRKMERNNSAEKEARQQEYLSLIFKAHENERKNIARELHDSVVQSLVVLTNNAQSIVVNKFDNTHEGRMTHEMTEVVKQVVTLRDMSREISKDIRNICLNLRPYIIDDMGLIPALRWLISRMKTNVAITLFSHGTERRLNPEIELMVYRIVQESINNINRHSMAGEAKIKIYFNNGNLRITIEDNGKGFVLPEKISNFTREGKLGLIGIQERVKFINGTIKIDSQPGQGTFITIEAPL